MTKTNNRKGNEDREEENDTKNNFIENTKMKQKEEKSVTCVTGLKYATDISALKVLEVEISDSKNFSVKEKQS